MFWRALGRRIRCVPLIICAVNVHSVHALELSAELYSDLEYSSNIGRVTTDTREDLSQAVGLEMSILERRKRFNVDANFNLEQEHFYNNSFSSQTSLTTGFGVLNFDIIENFLNWRTSFAREEVLSNNFDDDTPDNRGNRNVFRSGPSVTYRITRASTIGIAANYTNVENSDEGAADSERVSGSLNYGQALNTTTSFDINTEYDEIIDGDGAEELRNLRANIGISRMFSNGLLDFSVGLTESQSDLSDTVRGNFFDVSFVRQNLYWHTLNLQYKEDLSDTSIGFSDDDIELMQNESGELGAVSPALEASASLDVVARRSFTLGVSRVVDVFQYSVSGFWQDEDYKILSNDIKSRGFSLNLSQNIVPKVTAELSYSYTLKNYLEKTSLGKDREGKYRFGLNYDLIKDLSVSGFVQYGIRMNSQNQVREYEEFSTGITLGWDLL